MLCSPWVTEADLRRRAGCDDIDPLTLSDAALDASELLFALSGEQFPGLCTRTVRPAARPRNTPVGRWSERLFMASGVGYSANWGVCVMDALMSGGADSHSSCDWSRQVDLMTSPVRSIVAVLVDGQTVDPAHYRVDDDHLLTRIDGYSWPTCQDINLPSTEQNTFEVTYRYGFDPPSFGVSAAAAYGAELAKSRSSRPNRLPQRLTSITREGVTMAVLDPMQFLEKGLTGIPEVDAFLISVNSQRQKTPPMVYSPDVQQMRRTGTVYPPNPPQ